MKPPVFAIASILALILPAGAEPEKSAAEKFEIGVWSLPPGWVTAADSTQKNGERKPLPGFRRDEQGASLRYDASEFLKSNGVDLPPGSEAFYDPAAQVLVVRAHRNNLDNLEMLVRGTRCFGPANLATKLSVFRVQLPGKPPESGVKWPTWAKLQLLPATQRILLGRQSVLSRSGERVHFSQGNPPIPTPSVHAATGNATSEELTFQPGESSLRGEADVVLGVDGVTYDGRVAVCFRDPRQKTAAEVSFISTFTGWDGHPIVIHVAPVPDSPGESIVFVSRTDVVNEGGWAFRDLPAVSKP